MIGINAVLSIEMLNSLWPMVQAVADVMPRRWPAAMGPATADTPFQRGLSLTIGRDMDLHRPWSGLVSTSVTLSGEPHPRHEALLLRLASALVEDALVHSLQTISVGTVAIRGGRIGAEFRLIVEDDGWRPRSGTAWLADNADARKAAAAAGGHIRREVDWAVNRAIVALPF